MPSPIFFSDKQFGQLLADIVHALGNEHEGASMQGEKDNTHALAASKSVHSD